MSYDYSELNVINFALNNLGKLAVSSASEDANATLMSQKLPYLFQSLLLKTDWNFAKEYVTDSTPLLTTISSDYKYTYQLPPNFGSLWKTSATLPYAIVGNKLLANETPISYWYIVNEVDYGAIDVNFFMALVYCLSSNVALTVTQNMQVKQEQESAYQIKIADAILQNSMQARIVGAPYNNFDRVTVI